MRQLEVVGVRVEMATNNPIVLLKETEGERYLPIWIGPNEATAIAFAQQGMVPRAPLTHDLMRDMLAALDVHVTAANITALEDGIFTAYLVFSDGREVRSRPSDAVALALRTGASIYVTEVILDAAGVAVPDEEGDEQLRADDDVHSVYVVDPTLPHVLDDLAAQLDALIAKAPADMIDRLRNLSSQCAELALEVRQGKRP